MADQEQKTKKDDLDDEELKKEEELLKKKEEEEREARKALVMKRREEMAKRDEERRKATATNIDLESTETPKKQETKAKIREDVVQSGVAFLNHPKVKQAPLAQKMSFFQKKGLTPEEIQEALNRAGVSQTSTTSQQTPVQSIPQNTVPQYPPQSSYQQQVPYPYPPPPPPGSYAGPIVPAPKPVWYYSGMGLALTAVSCLSIGFGVAYLTKKIFSPLLFKNDEEVKKQIEEKKKEDEEQRKQTNKVIEDLANAMKSMHEDNVELKDLLKRYVDQIDTKNQKDSKALSKLTSKVSEIDSEVKKVRSMAVDSKVFQAPPTPFTPGKSSLPSWQQKSLNSQPTPVSTEINNATNAMNEIPKEVPKEIPKEKEEKKINNNGGMGNTPSSSKMAQITNMVQNGQIPDDVKDIDDSPQEFIPPEAEVTSQSKPKPWEKKKEETTK